MSPVARSWSARAISAAASPRVAAPGAGVASGGGGSAAGRTATGESPARCGLATTATAMPRAMQATTATIPSAGFLASAERIMAGMAGAAGRGALALPGNGMTSRCGSAGGPGRAGAGLARPGEDLWRGAKTGAGPPPLLARTVPAGSAPAGAAEARDGAEGARELAAGGGRRLLGIGRGAPCQVDPREQRAADLVAAPRRGAAGIELRAQFVDLLADLVEDRPQLAPFEADARGAALQLQRAGEGGKRLADAVERACWLACRGGGGVALGRLVLLPGERLRRRIGDPRVAEDIGKAAQHLA